MGDTKRTPEEIIDEYKRKKRRVFSISLGKIFGRLDFSLKNADKIFFFLVIGLALFGTFMVISTMSYQVIYEKNSLLGPLKSQIFFLAIGFLGLFFLQSLDYHKINMNKILLIGVVVLLLNILTHFIGYAEFGAKRWIKIGSFGFQASEPAKYFLAIFTAYVMSQKQKDISTFLKRYILLLTTTAVFAVIIAGLQSNLSTAIICFLVVISIIYASENELKWALYPVIVGAIGGIYALVSKSYRLKRVFSFVDNVFNPGSGSDQLNKSLYALGLGGLFGSGLGNSRMKAFWLPIAENDFIFAIIAEELGFIGATLLLGSLAYLVFRGIRIADNAPDKYGYLLGLSVILVIAFQILINIAVVIGLAPVTGVTLPFISKGGTSLIINLWAMGILLNISKQSKK